MIVFTIAVTNIYAVVNFRRCIMIFIFVLSSFSVKETKNLIEKTNTLPSFPLNHQKKLNLNSNYQKILDKKIEIFLMEQKCRECKKFDSLRCVY
jgi:hypothetical protein